MFVNNGEVGCSGSFVVEAFDLLLLPSLTIRGGLVTVGGGRRVESSICGFDVAAFGVVVVGANATGPRYVGVWALLGAAVK